MPHTDRTTTAQRRALHRDVSSTVGLLTDAQDFAAMRRYRTFVFDDHTAYLRQIEHLLKQLADRGGHTTVALFDPDDYAEYCAHAGLDPDTAAGRSRYTAHLAADGPHIPYTGQPMDRLVPLLVDTALRRATWQYAVTLLSGLGACADCGQDIGEAAFERAGRLLALLLDAAGPGSHHLVCSVPADEQLIAALTAEHPAGSPAARAPAAHDPAEAARFTTVLAAGIALGVPGGLVLRTHTPDAPDRVHGWRLEAGALHPLTAAEVFNAYCTDAETGEPIPPESHTDYRPGFPVVLDTPWPDHP
ncbi:hypothetical protein [Streptomyces sp. ODS05-4]|uniref:hypothetical protein n=1 Tax=Streptomyces sp. ODS05-4 TaxID=2944939 RepID=UPI00210C8428|nr:hypothetical protein [Streptomyces sp. ODS05-4]